MTNSTEEGSYYTVTPGTPQAQTFDHMDLPVSSHDMIPLANSPPEHVLRRHEDESPPHGANINPDNCPSPSPEKEYSPVLQRAAPPAVRPPPARAVAGHMRLEEEGDDGYDSPDALSSETSSASGRTHQEGTGSPDQEYPYSHKHVAAMEKIEEEDTPSEPPTKRKVTFGGVQTRVFSVEPKYIIRPYIGKMIPKNNEANKSADEKALKTEFGYVNRDKIPSFRKMNAALRRQSFRNMKPIAMEDGSPASDDSQGKVKSRSQSLDVNDAPDADRSDFGDVSERRDVPQDRTPNSPPHKYTSHRVQPPLSPTHKPQSPSHPNTNHHDTAKSSPSGSWTFGLSATYATPENNIPGYTKEQSPSPEKKSDHRQISINRQTHPRDYVYNTSNYGENGGKMGSDFHDTAGMYDGVRASGHNVYNSRTTIDQPRDHSYSQNSERLSPQRTIGDNGYRESEYSAESLSKNQSGQYDPYSMSDPSRNGGSSHMMSQQDDLSDLFGDMRVHIIQRPSRNTGSISSEQSISIGQYGEPQQKQTGNGTDSIYGTVRPSVHPTQKSPYGSVQYNHSDNTHSSPYGNVHSGAVQPSVYGSAQPSKHQNQTPGQTYGSIANNSHQAQSSTYGTVRQSHHPEQVTDSIYGTVRQSKPVSQAQVSNYSKGHGMDVIRENEGEGKSYIQASQTENVLSRLSELRRSNAGMSKQKREEKRAKRAAVYGQVAQSTQYGQVAPSTQKQTSPRVSPDRDISPHHTTQAGIPHQTQGSIPLQGQPAIPHQSQPQHSSQNPYNDNYYHVQPPQQRPNSLSDGPVRSYPRLGEVDSRHHMYASVDNVAQNARSRPPPGGYTRSQSISTQQLHQR